MDKDQAMKVMAESHRETVNELEDRIYAISESYRQEREYNHQLEKRNKLYREAIENTQVAIQKNLARWNYKDEVVLHNVFVHNKNLLESDCIHCNGKGFNGLDWCTQCNQKEGDPHESS